MFQKFGKSWAVTIFSVCSTILFFSIVIEGKAHQTDSVIYNFISNAETVDSNDAFLTEDSVVVITGAAGFIGSELALALHRTYSPKRIICIDKMGDRPEGREELARFEYLRQRVFNVMQTLGERGIFYRVDFTPVIPEYHDVSEIPVLDHIFEQNPDISHVVHLADPFPHSALQAVPREKDTPKAGMMEALLEQLAKHERDARAKSDNAEGDFSNTYRPPQFVYASSHEVYPPHREMSNESVMNGSIVAPLYKMLEESQTLSAPSSFRGASKIMDEMIAKLYYDTKGIYSVGLRFFSVYGPWGAPGSPLFEMAERAVSGDLIDLNDELDVSSYRSGLNGMNFVDTNFNTEESTTKSTSNDRWKKKKQDFVYIDDAVDAIMAAMQFRSKPTSQEGSPHPIIFNVASGEGHSLEDVLEIMHEFFPPKGQADASFSASNVASDPTGTVGSTKRAESLLGYSSQVSLREGITKMLAWHYDRTYPYGQTGKGKEIDVVAQEGIAGCSPFDKECLRGATVFPCASECSHTSQCTKSYYDEVIALTQKLTATCEAVLYTVDLDNSLTSLPTANPKLQTSKSFLPNNCNLAFVSQNSVLIKNKRGKSLSDGEVHRDGSWILIPLKIFSTNSNSEIGNKSAEMNEILKLLPKLSPGLFFQSKTTKRAVYIDSNIAIEDVSALITESYSQPYSETMEGATAMLIGRSAPEDHSSIDEEEIILNLLDPNFEYQNLESANTRVQDAAYRLVKLAVSNNQFGNEFVEMLDARWLVHGLESDDSRLFRCDVLGEIFQWEVTSDKSAFEFIIGLHDMWSRVITKASGLDPWWVGDNLAVVPEGKQQEATQRRRLQQQEEEQEEEEEEQEQEQQEQEVAVVSPEGRNSREAKDIPLSAEKESDEPEETDGDDARDKVVDDDASEEEETPDETSGEAEKERGEFVADAVAQKEVNADEEKRGDSSDEGPEEISALDDNEKTENAEEEKESQERDMSSWMGILSSSKTKYFVRIVPSSEVGVMSIESS